MLIDRLEPFADAPRADLVYAREVRAMEPGLRRDAAANHLTSAAQVWIDLVDVPARIYLMRRFQQSENENLEYFGRVLPLMPWYTQPAP